MDYKPVHIITNDELLNLKLVRDGPAFRIGSEDYTEAEGQHFHYYVEWPINQATGALSPTCRSAKRRWRKENYVRDHCPGCYDKAFATPCPECGIWYKLIWAKTADHHRNIIQYIRDKFVGHPEWAIPSPFPLEE